MKKLITMELIESLKPCENSLENAKKYYGNRTTGVTYAQFLGLKNIPHPDKVWVAFKLMNKDFIRFAAADIAELVLNIYECKYPGDLRPRKAIEAARAPEINFNAADAAARAAYAADAARAAAYAADDAARAAAYAANAAAYTAAYAADAAYAAYAAYAANAAAYASYTAYTAYTANAAAYAAADAAAHVRMEKQIKTILLKYLNKGRKKEN